MRQQGEIIKLENNRAWVKLADPGSACGNCKGCIRLTSKQQQDNEVLKMDINITAEVGDMVIIEYPDKVLLQAILVLYGIPFLGLFLGYFIAHWITGNDAASGFGAVLGLITFAVLTRPAARRLYQKTGEPQIVSKVCR